MCIAVLMAMFALASTACSTGVFLQKDPQSDAVEELKPGVHTRSDVVGVLGEPFISLPDRGVDVFKREGELVDVLFPGIPYTTSWTYYTLISYEPAGTLTGIDSGSYVYRSKLVADRFSYYFGQSGTLLEHEGAAAYLAPGPACNLVLHGVGNRWSDGLYYRQPIRLNDLTFEGYAPYFESYVYVSTAPGQQHLEVTWASIRGPWSRRHEFDCDAGEVLYVTLTDDRDGSPIVVTPEEPPTLPGRARVLRPQPASMGSDTEE